MLNGRKMPCKPKLKEHTQVSVFPLEKASGVSEGRLVSLVEQWEFLTVMPELCYFLFVCEKLKNSQQVLYVTVFQNVLFQLRHQASRMRALVVASGEC